MANTYIIWFIRYGEDREKIEVFCKEYLRRFYNKFGVKNEVYHRKRSIKKMGCKR